MRINNTTYVARAGSEVHFVAKISLKAKSRLRIILRENLKFDKFDVLVRRRKRYQLFTGQVVKLLIHLIFNCHFHQRRVP